MTHSFAGQAKNGKKKTLQDRFTPKPVAPPPWFFVACGVFAAIIVAVLLWVFFSSSSASEDEINAARDQQAMVQPEYVPVPGESGTPGSATTSESDDSSESSSSTTESSSGSTTEEKSPSSGSSEIDLKNPPTNFKSGKKVSVPASGGKDVKVPQGVKNLAVAGISASITGDWDDLPMQSQPANKTPLKDTEPDTGTFMLLNPGAATTTNTWVFSIRAVSDKGTYKQLRLIVTNTSSGLKLTPPVA